jgi:glycosyltransferase involved in cell wall biosynthesis
LDFEFVITLPEDCHRLRSVLKEAVDLNVPSRIKNEGRILVADGPKLYDPCDICFMPTVLETFSATYPEAMAMGLPIMTTNFQFASDVCQDAALYFEPTNAASAADCIQRLLHDPAQWRSLVARGKAVLQGLPTPRRKYEAYLRMLCDLVERKPALQPAMSQS